MTSTIAGIWHDVSTILKKSLGRIFTTHLAYTALGTILFAPLVGAIGKFLLHLSGKTALSDLDILYFFLTPSGITSIALLVALIITIIVAILVGFRLLDGVQTEDNVMVIAHTGERQAKPRKTPCPPYVRPSMMAPTGLR